MVTMTKCGKTFSGKFSTNLNLHLKSSVLVDTLYNQHELTREVLISSTFNMLIIKL